MRFWRHRFGQAEESRPGGGAQPRPAFVDLGALGLPETRGGRLEVRLELGGGLVLSLVRP